MATVGYEFTWLAKGLGGWNIDPVVGMMPQKVASAVAELGEKLVGAVYEPIAYLGNQVVNGTNHAVLAKQTIVAGVDQTNIVVLKFNEREMDCTLYAVEPVLQSGPAFGGYAINVEYGDNLSDTARETFDVMTRNWVGVSISPIALVASKVVKGVDFVFVAKVTPVVPNASAAIKLVSVNSVAQTIDFVDIL